MQTKMITARIIRYIKPSDLKSENIIKPPLSNYYVPVNHITSGKNSQQIKINFFIKSDIYAIIMGYYPRAHHHINTMVIIMNENPRRNSADSKQTKKDRYTAVLISQIFSLIVLILVFNFTVKPKAEAMENLRAILNEELFTLGDISEALSQYFTADNSWAVWGDNVTVTDESRGYPDEETTQTLTGSGGDDIEVYQAAANTSFSPVSITAPAIAPIVGGRYTSYFGYRINPITDKFSFHTGLDIAAPMGTKIRAVYNGTVTRVGEDSRAGKYIFLTHEDGMETFYCHCSEITVGEGSVIRQGETIAKVGSTGWSTGPHLHFEIRLGGIRYNPLYILDK